MVDKTFLGVLVMLRRWLQRNTCSPSGGAKMFLEVERDGELFAIQSALREELSPIWSVGAGAQPEVKVEDGHFLLSFSYYGFPLVIRSAQRRASQEFSRAF